MVATVRATRILPESTLNPTPTETSMVQGYRGNGIYIRWDEIERLCLSPETHVRIVASARSISTRRLLAVLYAAHVTYD